MIHRMYKFFLEEYFVILKNISQRLFSRVLMKSKYKTLAEYTGQTICFF